MKWISVKDQLPTEYDKEYIFYDGETVITGELTKIYPCWDMNGNVSYKENGICLNEVTGSYLNINNVTHWMPLPEPPES